jgi:hypothetical protein
MTDQQNGNPWKAFTPVPDKFRGQVKLEPRSIGLWKTDGKNLQPVPDMAGA